METVIEQKTGTAEMLSEVLEVLRQEQKSLPSKYFYDERGSNLFEEICELDEYYLTRTELNIMEQNISSMAGAIPDNCKLVELGSGSSLKTRLLLKALPGLQAYVPVDISEEFLNSVAENIRSEFPDLTVSPVATDYTKPFQLPESPEDCPNVAYFPGSTIGNFTREKAEEFMGVIAQIVGEDGSLLIGFDQIKNRQVLLDAYNDSEGVTAAFNKNILGRLNRDLGADFNLNQFKHKAIYNEEKNRIEMYLVSTTDQKVIIDERELLFRKGESIHTENSHKYSKKSFRELTQSHFKEVATWTDDQDYFGIQLLTRY